MTFSLRNCVRQTAHAHQLSARWLSSVGSNNPNQFGLFNHPKVIILRLKVLSKGNSHCLDKHFYLSQRRHLRRAVIKMAFKRTPFLNSRTKHIRQS